MALETELVEAIEAGAVNPQRWDLEALRAAGLGPCSETQIEEERVSVLRRQSARSRDVTKFSLAIMPTSQCNLACGYGGQAHRAGNMSPAIEDRALARVRGAIQRLRESHRSLSIGWFGGEPLLGFASIRRLSEGIRNLTSEAGVAWTSHMATNAVYLSADKARILAEESHLRAIEVTLDGPPTVHHASRPAKSGPQETFSRIVQNLRDIGDSSACDAIEISIRINVHQGNMASTPALISILEDNGFATPRFLINVVPVHDWGSSHAEGKVAAEAFQQWELELCNDLDLRGFTVSLFPTSPIETPCLATSLGSELIATNGRVFTCTEEVLSPGLDPSSSVGHVTLLDPALPRPAGTYDSWSEDLLTSPTAPCPSCAVLPLCGGACPKQWREGKTPCPTWKGTMPQRLDILARRLGLEPRDHKEAA